MKFIEDEVNSSLDVPWVNEYINSIGMADDISAVETIKATAKGLLIICKDFKGFLFRNSTTFNYIQDAIAYWSDNPNPGYSLFGKANRNGKLSLAIDEETFGIFTVEKGGTVIQRLKSDITQSTTDGFNPFIRPNTSVPTTSTKRRGTNGGTDGAKTSH